MTLPFRPTLQRLQPGTELSRFKTNREITAAWERDAAARCANITVEHRRRRAPYDLEPVHGGQQRVVTLTPCDLGLAVRPVTS